MGSLIVFMFGIILGSFLNVCIYRIPLAQSIVYNRSHCPVCNKTISWYDLIPVFSWLILKGRCRYCQALISARYLLVEVLTGLIFIACYVFFDVSYYFLGSIVFSCFLIVITFIDIDHQLIFDKVVIWLAVTGVLINTLFNFLSFWDMFIAAFICSGIMLIIAVASRGGMGGGDIKLIAAVGLWLGCKLTILTLFLAFVLGGIAGAVILLLKIKGRKDYIPFGPFIALAAFISLLYGNRFIDWYVANFL